MLVVDGGELVASHRLVMMGADDLVVEGVDDVVGAEVDDERVVLRRERRRVNRGGLIAN